MTCPVFAQGAQVTLFVPVGDQVCKNLLKRHKHFAQPIGMKSCVAPFKPPISNLANESNHSSGILLSAGLSTDKTSMGHNL